MISDSLTRRLAEFASQSIPIPDTARQVAALSMLDWVAVARAGINEPVARHMREMLVEEGGSPTAHAFGCAQPLPPRAAALLNGTTSHALDYDDTHFAHIGHPSVAILPAALALAEQRDLSVPELRDAALIGMEASIRVGLWLGRAHYQAGFHQTATAGTFGAALAAARLLGLEGGQMRQVIGLAATRAAGLKAQFGTMGKPYNAGLAAAAGVEVAQLIARGFDANPDALESAFGATHAGEGDLSGALEGLGQTWLSEAVSHKFHACCHGLHAALEAAREMDLAAPEIECLTLRTHPRWMDVCNQDAPETGLGAKFSYKTVLAMRALGYDTARLEVYADDICADPRLQSLRPRITVIADDSLSETAAHLTLLRRDGAQLENSHDIATPLSLEDRISRVQAKSAALIGPRLTDEIWALLQGAGPARAFARVATG